MAKYYTPSGRCIQAVKYLGGRDDDTSTLASSTSSSSTSTPANPAVPTTPSSTPTPAPPITNALTPNEKEKLEYIKQEREKTGDGATLVPENDRHIYYTSGGRPVKDNGGIEPGMYVVCSYYYYACLY